MDIKFDPEMVRVWLDVLHDGAPGLIHICATDNWAGQAFTDRDAANTYAAQLDAEGREGIYLRTTTLRGPLAPGQRGGEADAHAFPGLACDIDIAGPGHKTTQALPPDEDAALTIVKESGLPAPTLWVHSGGGMYPWWLLTQPHIIDSPDDIADLQSLSRQWEAVIAAAATRLGWHYGLGVRDLARVLRIPGTINRKEGLARPCVVASITNRRYTLDELRDALADATAALPEPEATTAPRHLTPVPAGDGSISPGDDYENRVDWADILTPRGWRYMRTRGRERHWQRPDKTGTEISATTGREPDRDRLFVFTTSTDFEAWRSYTKLAAYAILDHNGDYRAAAQALKADGYGRPTPLSGTVTEQNEAIAELVPAGRPHLTVIDGNTARVAEPVAITQATAYGPTEDGMARALVAQHGNELRYCPQRGRWLHWTGHRWLWDEAERHREFVRSLARALPDDAGWARFKQRAMSSNGVGGIVRLAQSDSAITVHIADLDARPYELNTPAGVVDLRTGEMRPPDPTALHTRSTAVAPDFDRTSDTFDRFLTDTFDDTVLISYVQRLLGISTIGTVLEQLLPFAHGSGANGKSTLLEAAMHTLGFGETGYAMAAPAEMLMVRRHAEHPAELAQLSGARLVVCSELDDGQRFAEARIKQLTGRDSINARFMRRDPFTFTPSHTMWLLGNHKPAAHTGGPAFWRRVRLLPFLRTVPEEKRDPKLGEKLVEDAAAVLAWIVRGAADYHENGLREPAVVRAATDAYEADQDTVGRFVEECCHLAPGQDQVRVYRDKLREGYEAWCREGGEEPVASKRFVQEVRNRATGEGVVRGRRFFSGLSLLTHPGDDDEEPRDRWAD